jgi:HPt (histidine-containing phosphotransfer) domain-containing protein
MDDYLAKPVTIDHLRECLSRWIGGGGGPANVRRDTPALDPTMLSQLRGLDLGDGGAFMSEVVGLFLTLAPERLEALRNAARNGDAAAVRRLAHSFRTSCGNVGAARMHNLCAELEEQARRGDGGTAALVEELFAEYEAVRPALEAARITAAG